MFTGGLNSTVSIVTNYRLDSLVYKCCCGQDFFRATKKISEAQSPIYYENSLIPEDEMARVWRWPPTHSVTEVMYTKSYNSTSLYVWLAWNGTAFTFSHIKKPYKHITTIGWRLLKIYALAPDYLFWRRYVQHFTHTLHRLSTSLTKCLFYSSTHPSQSPV